MRKIISIIITIVICVKLYSQSQVIEQYTKKRKTGFTTELLYKNVLRKDTIWSSYTIYKPDNLEQITHIINRYVETSTVTTTVLLYDNNKLKVLRNQKGSFLVNHYIAFHNNGFIDSIGNFEPYNENFRERVICDTIWYEDVPGAYSMDCHKGFQDKEWYFFDERGKIRMIKIYDKGVLLDIILPKEEEEE